MTTGVCVRPQCKFYHFPSANKQQHTPHMMMDHSSNFIGNFPQQQDHHHGHHGNNQMSMDSFPSNNN